VSAESDQNLMRRIRRGGDAAAFDVLFARHAPGVRSRLAGIVRDESWADDLTQEVFLRLWTRAEQWSGAGTVAGWLGRIATNLALNHLRSQRRRRQRPLPARPAEDDAAAGADWPADEAAFDPAELLERAERLESFRRCLDALPQAKRAVLKMIHEEDLDIAAVAAELGIPEGTVKSRLHYSIKRLARELGEAD
jgi:RNA polymerase sigma factor (sigma-70 family)